MRWCGTILLLNLVFKFPIKLCQNFSTNVNNCRMSLRPPPPYISSTGPPLPVWSLDLPLCEFLVFSPPPCSLFPDEPGRCLKHRRRQYSVRYGKTRHRPIYCRRSKRLRGEDAVPCGLASATTSRSLSCVAAASLFLASTCRIGGLVIADGVGGILPYHPSAVDAICRRRLPRSRFLAAPGPLSS